MLHTRYSIILVVFVNFVNISKSQGPPPPGAPGAPEEPEYVLNFESPVYVCSDDISQSFVDTSDVEVLQYNETTAMMSGIVKFLKGMDHGTMLILDIMKETAGNRHELVASHEICDLCDEICKADGNYKKYLQYFGFPDKCPFEPGNYPIHDLMADTSDMPIKKSNEGCYQIKITILKDEKGTCKDAVFMACLILDISIQPSS